MPLANIPIVDLGRGMREPGEMISEEWLELRDGVCEAELEGRGIAAAREGGRPFVCALAFVGEKPNRVAPGAAWAGFKDPRLSLDGFENNGLRPSSSMVSWVEARRFGRSPKALTGLSWSMVI